MSVHRWRASENYAGTLLYPLLFGPLALVSHLWTGFIVMGIAWMMSIVLLFAVISVVLLPLVHIARDLDRDECAGQQTTRECGGLGQSEIGSSYSVAFAQ